MQQGLSLACRKGSPPCRRSGLWKPAEWPSGENDGQAPVGILKPLLALPKPALSGFILKGGFPLLQSPSFLPIALRLLEGFP